MSSRCAAHSLAVGPDGLCVLCRRESVAAPVDRPPPTTYESSSSLVPVILASVLGLAFVGGAVAVGLFLAAGGPRDEETVADGRGVRDGHDPGRVRGHGARPQQPGAAPSPNGGMDPDLAEARSQVSIDVYSASWCGACRAARRYLDENGIAYNVRDVDHDPEASQRLGQLNPRRSIPVITFDGENPMVGFSADGLESRLNAAARRRMQTL